jgi:hypothetical protein
MYTGPGEWAGAAHNVAQGRARGKSSPPPSSPLPKVGPDPVGDWMGHLAQPCGPWIPAWFSGKGPKEDLGLRGHGGGVGEVVRGQWTNL